MIPVQIDFLFFEGKRNPNTAQQKGKTIIDAQEFLPDCTEEWHINKMVNQSSFCPTNFLLAGLLVG
jgi:hypothetical protein